MPRQGDTQSVYRLIYLEYTARGPDQKQNSKKVDIVVADFEALKAKVDVLSRNPLVDIISAARITERPLTEAQKSLLNNLVTHNRWQGEE
jgi:hypothetical protein